MGLFICSLLFLIIFLPIACSIDEEIGIEHDQDETEDDWYYLPSFPNYAPSGLPDFDQKQDENWQGRLGWSFCGPTALANVLWWFDSKHSDPNGKPGDGIDTYPLVRNYVSTDKQEPGPSLDDHNYNNINDQQTPWNGVLGEKELIERLAWYTNTNFCRNILIRGFGGCFNFHMKKGIEKWIKDAGLQDEYNVETIFKPSFSTINDRLRNNEGILLRLGFYIPSFRALSILTHHYIAVAGVNSNGSIAVSDPEWDMKNPCKDPTKHNDAGIVSHDVYQVNFTTPYPRLSSWWIPEFSIYRRVVVTHAIIISEIN